jgi:fatty acid desaturase
MEWNRPRFSAPELNVVMRELRQVDGRRNLRLLALDYLTLLAVWGGAIAFGEHRAGWGLAWAWNVPICALAVVLIGGVQHRLAALGHEASHYTLLQNKWLNDLVGDLLCLLPLTSSVHHYRYFHMAHHQFVNDPEHDPDLRNMERLAARGQRPRTKWAFAREHYLRVLLAPLSMFRYTADYIAGNVFGLGKNIYLERVEGEAARPERIRIGTILGIAFLVVIDLVFIVLERTGRTGWILPAGAVGYLAALIVLALLPEDALFRSPFRQPYGCRFEGGLRLGFLTAGLMALNVLRHATDGRSTVYFFVLWVVPLLTTFMYFMLLREVYQHGNAAIDRITNTRVFRVDPFTRWAVFVHGQDLHTPHHLFPGVPHYNLEALHQALKEHSPDYASRVIEVEGTFANRSGRPTILDEMIRAREASEPAALTG